MEEALLVLMRMLRMRVMAARFWAKVRSSSSRPRECAMAKEAVAIAFVAGKERAILAEGGSQMLVKRTGEPGTWREERVLARRVEVSGSKDVILSDLILK